MYYSTMAKITWNRNLEHEGLQLQSSEKPSQDIINQLKANGFRWSPRQKLWYAKETSYRVEFLSSIAAYEGEVGERLTFAEKMDAKVKHAADRAERFEALAEKTHDKANQLHSDAERMASVIPFGQPILIGHHSERSDRNYRDRIHNKYGKAFETFDKAKEYEEKASTASEYESRIFNVGTTLRRIKKLEAQQRSCLLDSDRHLLRWSSALARFKAGIDTERWDLLSREHLEWNERHYDAPQEQIDYWKSVVAKSGHKVWSPSDFKKGDRVTIRGSKATVTKINQKTIQVKYDEEWINNLNVTKVPFDELSQACKEV